MKAPLSLTACIALTCHLAIAADEPTAEAKWLQDANGCKFLSPSPARELGTITWTGQCSDGFVSGPGEVRVAQWLTFRGEFAQGRIVKGTIEYVGRESYEGQTFLDNRLHGNIVVRTLDGATIEAQYDHGKLKGEHADIAWPSGAHYSGEIDPRTRLSQGKGTLEYPDGSTYEGEFKQGHLTGTGVMKYANGEVRSGTFLDGALNGQGAILSPLVRYEGELRVGEPHGYGRVDRANGDSYEGSFVSGKPQGKGKLKEADGSSYEGEFLAGEFHGEGTMTWSDGNRYVGQFIGGKRQGTGKLTEPSGEWEEGEWQDGLLSGKCHIVDHENVYDGQCLEGKRSGYGRTQDKARQLVYEGEYSKDLYDGKGSLRVGDLVYEGTFKGGMMEGLGTLKVGKLTMSGDFKAGVLARGTIVGADGRTFEVDIEKNEILEVNKDGTKHPIDQLPTDITI